MDYLLFILYLLLFSWLVTRIAFLKKTGLSKPQLVILFLLKVIAGIFYGWVGQYYGGLAQMVDTWNYHYHGLLEYRLLESDPKEYLTNLFYDPYHNEGTNSFFSSHDSYWNDLKSNVFVKIMSIFDIFSFGHYYVNVIFYAFISLFGSIAFYRVMADVFPKQKPIVLLSIFVPSFLYWASGVHKEGLIFSGIALIVFHVYFAMQEKNLGVKRCAGILLGIFILFLLRNFILVIIVPAVIAWVLANKRPQQGLKVFTIVYVLFIIAFFTLRYVYSGFDFPQAVVSKQEAFMQLKGKSSIPTSKLEPGVSSFVKNTPQAISMSSLRPYPSDVRHLLSLAAMVETELILLLFVLFIFMRKKDIVNSRNAIYFSIFFSLSLLLTIGFTVNNLGAIVRYRSIALPFLVAVMACQVNWKSIGEFFAGKNKKNQASTTL